MTRRTSTEVYRRLEAEGVLSERRWEVYRVLYEDGPLTSAEVFDKLRSKSWYSPERSPLSQTRARFTELRDWGAIEEVGTKVCSVTGNEVILWDVTDQMPVAPSPVRKKETLDERVTRLERTVAALLDGDL